MPQALAPILGQYSCSDEVYSRPKHVCVLLVRGSIDWKDAFDGFFPLNSLNPLLHQITIDAEGGCRIFRFVNYEIGRRQIPLKNPKELVVINRLPKTKQEYRYDSTNT
jgi:hypothetical protein